VIIRILFKKDDLIHQLIIRLFSQLENVQPLQSDSKDAKVVTMIVDKDMCLVIEMKDDLESSIAESAGLATYSNSRPTVLACDKIFEMIWLQTEMKQQNSSSTV
jgi:hypothetical protein